MTKQPLLIDEQMQYPPGTWVLAWLTLPPHDGHYPMLGKVAGYEMRSRYRHHTDNLPYAFLTNAQMSAWLPVTHIVEAVDIGQLTTKLRALGFEIPEAQA